MLYPYSAIIVWDPCTSPTTSELGLFNLQPQSARGLLVKRGCHNLLKLSFIKLQAVLKSLNLYFQVENLHNGNNLTENGKTKTKK